MEPFVIRTEAQKMLTAGEGMEGILEMLRTRGLSKVMSIKMLAQLGIPLAQAKIAVHESEVWSDVRGSHDRFSESMEQVLDELPSDKE
jgi:hypothetical protein